MPIFLIMCGIDVVFVNYFTHDTDVKRKVSTQLLSIFSYVYEKEYEFMKKYILLIVFLIPISMVLFAQVKPVVVVAPFDAKGVDKDEVEVVTELFTAEYANTGVASVVDRNSFDKIKEQLKFQSSDWSNADKVAQLGKALNANHVIVGQILEFKRQIITTIKIIDVNTTTILASHTEKLENIDDLLDKLREICAKLSNKVGIDSMKYKIGDEGEGGGIVFYVSPGGFDVYDGKGSVMRCHYLEMSKAILGESKRGEYTSGTENGLGCGKSNTYKIYKENKETWYPTVNNCAAYRCMKYKTPTSKVGEWFLPSYEEAKLMIETQSERLNADATRYYCTSDEHWFQGVKGRFTSTTGYNLSSYSYYSVRAIRAF